jgi:hypothetical protein
VPPSAQARRSDAINESTAEGIGVVRGAGALDSASVPCVAVRTLTSSPVLIERLDERGREGGCWQPVCVCLHVCWFGLVRDGHLCCPMVPLIGSGAMLHTFRGTLARHITDAPLTALPRSGCATCASCTREARSPSRASTSGSRRCPRAASARSGEHHTGDKEGCTPSLRISQTSRRAPLQPVIFFTGSLYLTQGCLCTHIHPCRVCHVCTV